MVATLRDLEAFARAEKAALAELAQEANRPLRTLPERPNLAGRDPIALLCACGALLVRGDVDRALRGARRTANPAALERRILHQAFGHDAVAAARTTRPLHGLSRGESLR